jgi:hypothetical protein
LCERHDSECRAGNLSKRAFEKSPLEGGSGGVARHRVEKKRLLNTL